MDYYRLQIIPLCAIGPKIGLAQAILSFVFVHKLPIAMPANTYIEFANRRFAVFIVNWITIVCMVNVDRKVCAKLNNLRWVCCAPGTAATNATAGKA